MRRLLYAKTKAGADHQDRSISYYWFVGHDCVTSSFKSLRAEDSVDRDRSGYDQRWACITITAYLDPVPVLENAEGSKDLKPAQTSNGHALSRRALTSAQADELAVEFIGDLGPDIISVDEIKEWSKE